jgi:transcriptional regulator of acetoin/glycerol metabolism
MPHDLFPESGGPAAEASDPDVSLAAARDAAERRQIQKVLRETRGQIGEAAKRLEVARTTLWEKMRRYGIAIDGLAK